MAVERTTSLQIVRAAFTPLVDLPCWQVTAEYGSWLRFDFGIPRVHVNEPCEATRHLRLAGVYGQYELWIDMCDWVVFQDGARLAHSESDRETMQRTAATLQGQKLVGFGIAIRPASGEFVFDLGARLSFRCYERHEADHGLWHLSTAREGNDCQIITFTASGTVSVFEQRGAQQSEVEQSCNDFWISVQSDAPPESRPPSPFPLSPDVQSSDSLRTSSLGGYGRDR